MYATSRLDKTVRGVYYVALGRNAEREANLSRDTLPEGLQVQINTKVLDADLSIEQQAHLLKTRAIHDSPYQHTLLIDADTRVKSSLAVGFSILSDGWDLVMVPSFPKADSWVLWNLTAAEKAYTIEVLGTWSHIMLNTGVMFFAKNERTERLFNTWSVEWMKFRDRDQGAFLRALAKCPVKLWLLGKAYNSAEGEVVQHLFGRAV